MADLEASPAESESSSSAATFFPRSTGDAIDSARQRSAPSLPSAALIRDDYDRISTIEDFEIFMRRAR